MSANDRGSETTEPETTRRKPKPSRSIRCKTTQWHLSARGGQASNQRSQRHLVSCLDCREFSQSLQRLETSLRSNRKLAPAPREQPAPRPLWGTAVGGAVVAAAAVLVYVAVSSANQSSPNESSPPKASHALAAPTGTAELPNTPRSAATAHVESFLGLPLVSSATRLMTRVRALGDEGDPLERELDAWRADGLRGLHSIRSLGHGKSL